MVVDMQERCSAYMEVTARLTSGAARGKAREKKVEKFGEKFIAQCALVVE
jgi:hypothetical protein